MANVLVDNFYNYNDYHNDKFPIKRVHREIKSDKINNKEIKPIPIDIRKTNQTINDFFFNKTEPISIEDVTILKQFAQSLYPYYFIEEHKSEYKYELSIKQNIADDYNFLPHYVLNVTTYCNQKMLLHVKFDNLEYTQYQIFEYVIQLYQSQNCDKIYNTKLNKYHLIKKGTIWGKVAYLRDEFEKDDYIDYSNSDDSDYDSDNEVIDLDHKNNQTKINFSTTIKKIIYDTFNEKCELDCHIKFNGNNIIRYNSYPISKVLDLRCNDLAIFIKNFTKTSKFYIIEVTNKNCTTEYEIISDDSVQNILQNVLSLAKFFKAENIINFYSTTNELNDYFNIKSHYFKIQTKSPMKTFIKKQIYNNDGLLVFDGSCHLTKNSQMLIDNDSFNGWNGMRVNEFKPYDSSSNKSVIITNNVRDHLNNLSVPVPDFLIESQNKNSDDLIKQYIMKKYNHFDVKQLQKKDKTYTLTTLNYNKDNKLLSKKTRIFEIKPLANEVPDEEELHHPVAVMPIARRVHDDDPNEVPVELPIARRIQGPNGIPGIQGDIGPRGIHGLFRHRKHFIDVHHNQIEQEIYNPNDNTIISYYVEKSRSLDENTKEIMSNIYVIDDNYRIEFNKHGIETIDDNPVRICEKKIYKDNNLIYHGLIDGNDITVTVNNIDDEDKIKLNFRVGSNLYLITNLGFNLDNLHKKYNNDNNNEEENGNSQIINLNRHKKEVFVTPDDKYKYEFTYNYANERDFMYSCGKDDLMTKNIVVTKSENGTGNIDGIDQHNYDSNGQQKNSKFIDESNRLVIKALSQDEIKNGRIGYKAAQTGNQKMCIVKLFLPQEARVAWDQHKDKYRTDKAMVLSIKKVYYEKKRHFYMKDFNLEDCGVCLDAPSTHIAHPCRHKLCGSCWKDLIDVGQSKKCPCCRGEIDNIEEVPVQKLPEDVDIKEEEDIVEAFSCVHTDQFMYRVGELVSIANFDGNLKKVCGPGIHFHDKEKDVFQWFEYMNIPDNVLIDNIPWNDDYSKSYTKLKEKKIKYKTGSKEHSGDDKNENQKSNKFSFGDSFGKMMDDIEDFVHTFSTKGRTDKPGKKKKGNV